MDWSHLAYPTVTARELAAAPVPSLCQHPAGNLVGGSLPGIPPNDGTVQLAARLYDGNSGIVYGDLNGDGSKDAAAVIECNRGGVAWPDSVQFYTNGPNGLTRLGGVSLDTLSQQQGAGPDSRDGVHDIRYANGAVTVNWYANRPSDFGCCPTMTFSATLHYNGSSVAGDNLTRYDETSAAKRLFSALASADTATVDQLATPEVASGLEDDVANGLDVQWVGGRCYGWAPISDPNWPAAAINEFSEWPPGGDIQTYGQRYCLVRSSTGVGPYGVVGFSQTSFRVWQAVSYYSPHNFD